MKGSMLKRSTRKPSARDKTAKMSTSPIKISFQDPVGHELPPSLHSFRWNVDKVERKLQEKIQEKTKIAGNFVYQQAYRLLECTRGEGIDFVSFKEQLRIKFGIILEDGELQLLFDKYDEDRNGTIDLNEFIRRVLPPDYNYGRQWFEISQQQSDEKQAALKRESRNEFLSGMGVVKDDTLDNTGEASNWTLETLMKQIQTKVVQKTPSGDDQYRRAFKMLRSGRDQGIRMKELRNNLKTKFGIFISEKQMKDLFSQFDIDGSGEIDLKEFLSFVEPPAYPGNSKVPRGIWTDDGDDEEDEQEENGEPNAGDYGQDQGDVAYYNDEDVAPVRGGHRYHAHDRPPSARGPRAVEDTQYGGHHSSPVPRAVNGASGPSTSTKNVIKKERPGSANPKKQAMLKQRREQMSASASQILMERHMKDTEGTSGCTGGCHSVAKGTQTQARRQSMSMADIHSSYHADRPATADAGKRVSYNLGHNHHHHHYEDADECVSVHSGSSVASSVRPRSAGSVASRQSSSVTVSANGSVRGASYMRRPSTPQYLRQKCLESRIAGAVAAAPVTQTQSDVRNLQAKLKKRLSGGPPVAAKRTGAAVVERSGHGGGHHDRERDRGHERERDTRDREARRHSYSDVASVQSEEAEYYEAPRVMRVHPKQHDTRPFSQGGRVLMRSKVSSAGCR